MEKKEDREIKSTEASGSSNLYEKSDYRTKLIQQAITLSSQLQDIIAQSNTEFNNLPIFVRPIVRGWFKSKAGQSIQDWANTVANLTEQLKKMEISDVTAEAALRASYSNLRGLLAKLIECCQAVPDETTRFTKDMSVLRDVRQVAAQREASIRSLISALDTLMFDKQ